MADTPPGDWTPAPPPPPGPPWARNPRLAAVIAGLVVLVLVAAVAAALIRDDDDGEEIVAGAGASTTVEVTTTTIEVTTTSLPPPTAVAPAVAPTTAAPPVTKAPPPPTTAGAPTFNLSPTSGPPGTRFTASGTGCAGERAGVSLTIYRADGSGVTGNGGASLPDGSWQLEEGLPPHEPPGDYKITVDCREDATILFSYQPRTFTITP